MMESKTERFKIAHDIIEKMTDEELAISLIRAGLLRQYEMQINELTDDLSAANARIAKYEKLMAAIKQFHPGHTKNCNYVVSDFEGNCDCGFREFQRAVAEVQK